MLGDAVELSIAGKEVFGEEECEPWKEACRGRIGVGALGTTGIAIGR